MNKTNRGLAAQTSNRREPRSEAPCKVRNLPETIAPEAGNYKALMERAEDLSRRCDHLKTVAETLVEVAGRLADKNLFTAAVEKAFTEQLQF